MALIKDGKVYRTFEEQMIYLTEDNSKIKSSIDNIKTDKQDNLIAGNNITIDENNVISSNVDISGKQDKLTAGENITIEDNVISASGAVYLPEQTAIALDDRPVFLYFDIPQDFKLINIFVSCWYNGQGIHEITFNRAIVDNVYLSFYVGAVSDNVTANIQVKTLDIEHGAAMELAIFPSTEPIEYNIGVTYIT